MGFKIFRPYFRVSVIAACLGLWLHPLPAQAQERLAVKVAPFSVNGPASQAYLGSAARDAVVGALIQKAWVAEPLTKEIAPEKLSNVRQGGKDTGLLVTGRLNVVGSQVRALLKWVDVQGQAGQGYVSATSVENLLPQLEKFAAEKLPAPAFPATAKQVKEVEHSTWERAEVPPSPPPSAKTQAEPKDLSSTRPVGWDKQGKGRVQSDIELRDYQYVSERLPFEVRGVGYGDVTGDGQAEVLMTSQRSLYVYSFQNRELKLLSEYRGSKLDYFVKVEVWQNSPQGPLIALTVLREDCAVSRLLRYAGGQFSTVVNDQPYALRVMKTPERGEMLLGSYYTPSRKTGNQSIVPLTLQGNRFVKGERLDLPQNATLYNFVWVEMPGTHEVGVVTLSSEGKLRLYQRKENRYRRLWTSRGDYGGTGNYVPVKVKDFFNETVGNYYGVPVTLRAIDKNGRPEIVVVKNTSLVKGVIGRVPLIADGQIYRLTWDAMGFVETWKSKKVDGSLQDLLVTPDSSQLMGVLKLRDPGLLGQIERNDSVLLLYDL